ncbi:hypothetical protein KIV56_17145 [Cryobacterium breve]|uniref:AbiEi antitoxin C-terminal domain-containing protein n=1 Tax=Cryobacterium breve TaxID=1259258 RepID=A0ABY7NCZ8_9MICO|nr:hypothetical protein [Cryobacterium breve]WBM79872.1 hypothetical protein KIV56_17145 [Cryobacterium breve]
MVQVTERDLAMVDWLGTVRLAEVDAIRWALGAMLGSAEPISTRKAQHWIMRMVEAGLVARARPTFQGASIVWATHDAVGRKPPNLFRQTTRHEVAVASVSARYLCLGFTWQRDRRPVGVRDHQADGLATYGGQVELVEVEPDGEVLTSLQADLRESREAPHPGRDIEGYLLLHRGCLPGRESGGGQVHLSYRTPASRLHDRFR